MFVTSREKVVVFTHNKILASGIERGLESISIKGPFGSFYGTFQMMLNSSSLFLCPAVIPKSESLTSCFLSSIFQLQHRCKAHGPFGVLGRLATKTVFNIVEGLVIIVKLWFQIRFPKYCVGEMSGSPQIVMETFVMKVWKFFQF